MVARDDPADPARYIGVFGDDLSDAVAIYRDGRRVRTTVPQILQRGDEIETALNVIAVIRYPAGDVYIDAATLARVGSLDVLFGKVFARVRGFFSVENQNVVAGVEGTEFAFEVAGDGTVHVTVLDGTVRCSSKTLSWNSVRVARGQAFAATDSNREPRVGPAAPAELAQLRSWVRRVDNAVAPPTPPQPIPAPPLPPVPPTQWGYCCDAGRVFRTTLDGCRGSLYNTQAEAYQQCRPVTMGYCCANGQVTTTTRDRCRGSFYFDQASARKSCASPPPQSGYCCANGQVTSTTRNQCRGNYFTDEASARKSCAPPPQPGYCCAGGEVSQTNRAQCRGSFFTDQASARKSCASPPPQPSGYCCANGQVTTAIRNQCRGKFFTDEASARKSCAPPQQGYCCAGGKVSQTTRDRCTGTFTRVQDEAQRMCKRKSEVQIERGMVERLPRTDAPR